MNDFQPFATVDDLRQRWVSIPKFEDSQIEAHLNDVSLFILDHAPDITETVSPGTLRRITCQITRRALEAESHNFGGLESVQLGTGPFQDSFKPVNPHGDYYFTALEKKILGIGKQKAASIDLLGSGS